MPTAKLNRTVLRLSGEGVASWLEGLITNTLSGHLTFAALLTPQGKIIADFFLWQDPSNANEIIIDTPKKFGSDLLKRLKMYRLRAPITLEDISNAVHIYAVWDAPDTGVTHNQNRMDPRGHGINRFISPDLLATTASSETWDSYRLSVNIPDSEWDFGSAEIFPANANMDRLAGVNFKKGCFVGQEVVSRMHRKTEVKKRLCAFEISGGTPIDQITAKGRVVGDILHIRGARGMAMIRFDRLEKPEDTPLESGLKSGLESGSAAIRLIPNNPTA